MRILVLTNYYPPFELGGWGQLTQEMVEGLRARGHLVRVLTSNYRAQETVGPETGVARVLHLSSPDHLSYHASYSLRFRRWREQNLRSLAGEMRAFDPEILFINGMWNLDPALAVAAEDRMPGRVVYYLASPWPTDPDPHLAYWTLPAARGLRRWPKRVAGWVVLRTFLGSRNGRRPRMGRVLCVSEYMRQYLVEQVGVPAAHTKVVYNGIDLDKFPWQERRSPPLPLRLLYAGRLSPDKGVHTAVEGFARFRNIHPEHPACLTVLGEGPSFYRDRLGRLAEGLGSTDAVRFRGAVPRHQMPQVLADHDVLVFPSVWQEPLARMVQEAMACGLVVIGTTTGGTEELLVEGETGLTFEAEDAAGLARQMARLVEQPDLFGRLARAARKAVEERFTLGRMIDELESTFYEVLGAAVAK